tara:strand:- start:371 stop:649 length:279 start_codon:yes stop_codon:yes gene_type:complete
MRNYLFILILLVSTAVFSQETSINDGPFTRSISQKDLPIGEKFMVIPLNGSASFSGVIGEETIHYMPINVPFILKIEGAEARKFDIYDYKSK